MFSWGTKVDLSAEYVSILDTMKLCDQCDRLFRTKGNICATCTSRNYRAKYPIRYAYSCLRSNSKRRGIPFTISLEYFKQFCHEYDYIQRKGVTKNSLSVDRIKNHLGYIPGNIQALTVSNNSKKGKKKLVYDDMSGGLRVQDLTHRNEEDNGFNSCD